MKESNRLHGQHSVGPVAATKKDRRLHFKAAGRSKQSNKQIECGFDTFAWVESLQLSPFDNGF